MSTINKKKCDRCGKIIDGESKIAALQIGSDMVIEYEDVCAACEERLRELAVSNFGKSRKPRTAKAEDGESVPKKPRKLRKGTKKEKGGGEVDATGKENE